MKKTLLFILLFISLLGYSQSNLVITEIMYNPPESGLDSLEFIELHNIGGTPIDLTGYYFSAGVNFNFPSMSLPGGAYIVVTEDTAALFNQLGVTAYQWTGSLNNGGELIEIRDSNGMLIDSVDYDDGGGWPSGSSSGLPDGGGASIELCSHILDNSIDTLWKASIASTGAIINGENILASPGAQNSVNCPFTTTLKKSKINNIRLYPNPAHNILNFSTNIKHVSITDISGKTVLEKTNTTSVLLHSINKGIYMVTLNNEIVKQIVIQ